MCLSWLDLIVTVELADFGKGRLGTFELAGF